MSDVSVVTINYNNGAGLSATMESVLAQSCPGLEYIVIDGGSTDGSRDVIARRSTRLAFWVCEPDRGIYHAMNKGIVNATGRYVLFLNSGDYFHSADALERLLSASDDRDIVYGDLILHEAGVRKMWRCPDTLSFNHFRRSSLPHPASLIKRSLFDSMHLYDEDLRIVADWAFFAEAICLRHATCKRVPFPVSEFHTDGVSSDASHKDLVNREREASLRKHFGAFLPDYETYDQQEAALSTGFCRLGRRIDRAVLRVGLKLHAWRRTGETRRSGDMRDP